jgi:hypothetical protein
VLAAKLREYKNLWPKFIDAANHQKQSEAGVRRPAPLIPMSVYWHRALQLTLLEAKFFDVQLSADGKTTDPLTCLKLWMRLVRWNEALNQYDEHHALRLNRDYRTFAEDHSAAAGEIKEAVLRGWDASQEHRARSREVIEYASRLAQLQREARTRFHRWAQGGQEDNWRHRELETWLILVWPFVEEEKLNYSDVLRFAGQRFSNFDSVYPLDTSKHLSKYCKKVLHLKVTAAVGRPKDVSKTAAENFLRNIQLAEFSSPL